MSDLAGARREPEQLPAREVTMRVGELVDDRLTDLDREQLESGAIRWENRVQFARLRLVDRGLLKKGSPRGVWEISDEGRGAASGDKG